MANNLSTLNYSDNKTLFDALLALLTQDGAAGLLKQLLDCKASGSLYFDNSSVKVLQESAKEVTKSGDAESYKTILDKLGKSNLPNVKQDLITINANNDKDSAVVNAITFDSICSSINIEGKDSLDQSENVITINDVFFTGRDEAIPLTEFSLRDDLSTINVFINFRECTAQTRLVIKWFYEEQTVPIVETKISNGDFVEGVLKSSISFSDETGILTGTYHLKIYIDGQEASIYEKDFNIID